ncbi:hypothetical protein OG429_38750 [Streptomyces sp. NBC_00190]|uniref:hypothetical protein n=1 Tax=unclassified Streptomyces TaxID=2593676 RepID=UPI002E281F15|nr:hypothetical protein [Streptomyces sp. NBC_00190]WSZ45318.1 hypothetical protein OG239_41180 [Streptomyces sp. NBC_00868]
MPAPTSPQSKLRGFLTQPKHKVADFADALALGYQYEYTDQLNAAFDVLAPPTPLPSRLRSWRRSRSLRCPTPGS